MPEPREREWNEKGEYEELYPPEEVYAVIEDMPNQVATTGDISNALGCTIDSGRNKLKELRFQHKIKKRDAGGRSDLWYIPIEDEDDSEAAEAADGDETADTDMALKRLSRELDDPITVGDTVYENGDKHPATEN